MSVHRLDDWRTAGCGDECFARRHDPLSHERYGYVLALLKPPLRVVKTGPLVVDLVRCEARVNGIVAPLMNLGQTPRSEQRRWRMLESIATRAGDLVPNDVLIREVLDVNYCTRAEVRALNHVRYRLRQALGDAGPLVSVSAGLGMRLEMEPPA